MGKSLMLPIIVQAHRSTASRGPQCFSFHMQLFHFYFTIFYFLFTLNASSKFIEFGNNSIVMKARYFNGPELALLEAAQKGDLTIVCQSLLEHSFDQDMIDRSLFKAIEHNQLAVVEKLFESREFCTKVLHHGIILAGMKNADSTLTFFLQTGRYDPADLRLVYTEALTKNCPLAIRALLVSRQFGLSDANRQAGIKYASEKNFVEILTLLQTDRKKLQEDDSPGMCVLF